MAFIKGTYLYLNIGSMLICVSKNTMPQILRIILQNIQNKSVYPGGRIIPYKKKANKLLEDVWKSTVVRRAIGFIKSNISNPSIGSS